MSDQSLNLILCGAWVEAVHSLNPGVGKDLCGLCGDEVVYLLSNKARMTKEQIVPICIGCLEQYSQLKAQQGEPLVFKGRLIGGKDDMQRHSEN